MRKPWFVFLLGCLLALHCGPVRAGESLACDMPADLLNPGTRLSATAKGLADHQLNILAIGSGSTVGDTGGAGGPGMAYYAPGASFPYRMVDALRASRPGLDVNLTVRGGRNMGSFAMLQLLRQELAKSRYNIVLWQTGTVEAVHGVRPDSLRDDLTDGVTAANEAHTDLILVDPQFSRFLRANADIAPYENVLQQVAGNDGVSLFPRLALTREWVDSGQIDLERVKREDRDQTVALLNTCIGTALARFILEGSAQH